MDYVAKFAVAGAAANLTDQVTEIRDRLLHQREALLDSEPG